MAKSKFKTIPIQIGRLTSPTGTTWGTPTVTYIGTIEASVQPFTGDDNTVNNQFKENVKDMIVIYDVDANIQFDDRLFYRNTVTKVVYKLTYDMGVIPHLEVFTADTQDKNTDWTV